MIRNRRDTSGIKRKALEQGILLKVDDFKPAKNKKYPYYTPARDKDVFNNRRWDPFPCKIQNTDLQLVERCYHRRNDIQPSIAQGRKTVIILSSNQARPILGASIRHQSLVSSQETSSTSSFTSSTRSSSQNGSIQSRGTLSSFGLRTKWMRRKNQASNSHFDLRILEEDSSYTTETEAPLADFNDFDDFEFDFNQF